MKTLTIRLTAPLQSYGNQATFNQRTSSPYPTKSAILGMIAAALGIRREETQKLRSLNQLSFAVRVEQAGQIFTEFQTVEYRKSATKTARKLTYRDYLQDAVFMVAIGGSDEEIDKIVNALKYPKFALYLGRRSNPPAGRLKIKTFNEENPLEVLRKLEWQASDWYKKKYKEKEYTTQIYADADLLSDKSSYLVKDKIASLDQRNRYYDYRAAAEENITLKNPEYSQDDSKDYDYFAID